MNHYYEYKKESFKCSECGWTGKGAKTEIGEIFESVFEIDCPKCGNKVGSVMYPTEKEMLKYGTEEEKREIRERKEYLDKRNEPALTSAEQLPEIEGDNLVFKIVEKEIDNYPYILIMHNDELIWQEMVGYEYFERFITLGKMFKKKYGSRMTDFISPDSVYLYGDNIRAAWIVEDFIKSLKNND